MSKPRKINPYVLRNKKLKIEESKRAKRQVFNWKKRQQHKAKRKTKVLNISEGLPKKVLKKSKNKKRKQGD